jgi:3-phosphoshikimate 1-carboxyvinyltransferase
MTSLIVNASGPLRGSVTVPGDKSITHRALILGALAEGETRVHGWVPAEVCLATLRCVQALGVEVEDVLGASEVSGTRDLLMHGVGLQGLREPADVLHCAGSGTTIRLLAGLLAGQPFTSVLTGTEPLRRRPMGRVAEPLRQMGAPILGREGGRLAPLTIRGGGLRGIDFTLPVASAQVKTESCWPACLLQARRSFTSPDHRAITPNGCWRSSRLRLTLR